MAGKSRKQAGSRPSTPKTARGMMGHMGLKSNAFAPTDSKLTSQYMVLDHMTAHYRKVSSAKAAVDTSCPKAWLISQKARDHSHREALDTEYRRRDAWLQNQTSRSSRASSQDREEMIAMMKSFNANNQGLDGVDAKVANTTMEAHASDTDFTSVKLDSQDIKLVDQIVSDNLQSPSKYHSPKPAHSNIRSSRHQKTALPASKGANRRGPGHTSHAGKVHSQTVQQYRAQPTTPRSGDLIHTRGHVFTEAKPFTPRTLKYKHVQSKLSEFKYYTPPMRKAMRGDVEDYDEVDTGPAGPQPAFSAGRPAASRGGGALRPETPLTEMGSLMNETLMSRDMNHERMRSDVPPLDISLDADHMRWLQEQSEKAQLRASYRSARSDATSQRGPVRRHGNAMAETQQGAKLQTQEYRTLNGTQPHPERYPYVSSATLKLEAEENELRYLEFIQDVTTDVLDRGIFTNRVLIQVFEAHVERRKKDLKVDKMRSMLDDLRRSLGIPDKLESDDIGLATTRCSSPEHAISSTAGGGLSRAARRRTVEHNTTVNAGNVKANLPNLRSGGQGRPPLPRPVSRGSRSRPGSACSNLHEVKEENEVENDILRRATGTGSDKKTTAEDLASGESMKDGTLEADKEMTSLVHLVGSEADILTIDHEDEPAEEAGGTMETNGIHAEESYEAYAGVEAAEDRRQSTDEEGTLTPLQEDKTETDWGAEEDERDGDLHNGNHDEPSEGHGDEASGESDAERERQDEEDEGEEEKEEEDLVKTYEETMRYNEEFSDEDEEEEKEDERSAVGEEDEDGPDAPPRDFGKTIRPSPPKPSPRRKSGLSTPRSEVTPRSTDQTYTSESVIVSELDTEDDDDF